MPPIPALAVSEDLLDYPGAPFSESVVAAASGSVRSDARWHIAPVISETVTVDGSAHTLLLLPTMRLVSVQAVRVWDSLTSSWAPRTGWRIAGSGMLYHPDGWRFGFAGVEVDMMHGYDDTPADLFPVIAARCQRARVDATITQRSETVGARTSSEAYDINRLQSETSCSDLGRYTLTARVA